MNQPSPIPVLHPITRLIVGGAQENTMYTAAGLDKTRFAAAVVAGPQTGSEGSLIEALGALGVPLTILPQLLRQISPINEVLALWKLYRLMRAGQYRIVHTHSSKAGILGRVAAKLAGVPVIVHTVHGWSFHDQMHPLLKQVYILLERLCAPLSDALILVAEPDRRKGLENGIGKPAQYTLIRSAIPLGDFDPAKVDGAAVRQELGIPSGAPVLGNVGRFSPQKNPIDWLRIASVVAAEMPLAHFLLVGDGPLRPKVEAQISAFGLQDRFTLTGLRRDVDRMLAAMDVFLLTSLWEGLPRVIPQAFSMGLPVIANRADGTVEAIRPGQDGYLCDPGDLESMAAACITLLNDPALRQTMGQNGQAYARRYFDLDEMISQIEGLYQRLLAEKGLG